MLLRFQAISNLTKNTEISHVSGSTKITSIFGENVFSLKTARKFFSDDAYKSISSSIKEGKKN